MLTNFGAEALMRDAREVQAEGVRMVEAGDWRDGAGKGWVGVRNATAALVWAVTGVRPRNSSSIAARLRGLARVHGGEYAELHNRWGYFANHLHQSANYDGIYDDDLPALVRAVADYIRRAEELAGLGGDEG